MTDDEGIPKKELQHRVLYSMMTPIVRMARVFGVPLKELVGWFETAYFQEVRATGATLKETSTKLGVSQRTAVKLSKQLRESFFLPEIEHNLPRQIEFVLWARPMSEARLQQVLTGAPPEHVSEAIKTLLREGRIKEKPGRTLMYETCSNVRRLPRDTWMARIGALNSLSENLANTTFGRFFKSEPKAFARTLTFQLPPGGSKRLDAFYEDVVIPHLTELTEETVAGEESEDVQLSLMWAPYEYIQNIDEGEEP